MLQSLLWCGAMKVNVAIIAVLRSVLAQTLLFHMGQWNVAIIALVRCNESERRNRCSAAWCSGTNVVVPHGTMESSNHCSRCGAMKVNVAIIAVVFWHKRCCSTGTVECRNHCFGVVQ